MYLQNQFLHWKTETVQQLWTCLCLVELFILAYIVLCTSGRQKIISIIMSSVILTSLIRGKHGRRDCNIEIILEKKSKIFTTSLLKQNHRLWLRHKDTSGDHLVQLFAQSRVTEDRLLGAMTSWALNISKMDISQPFCTTCSTVGPP